MDVLSLWRKWRQRARPCVLCHDSASDGLCERCTEELQACQTVAADSCPLCFTPIRGGAVCGACQKKPPVFERLWASVYYEPPVSSMIRQFKHLRDLGMRRPLVQLMQNHAPDWLDQETFDCVLAVPLSRQRRLFRGFNQSEELAAALAKSYGWRLLPYTCIERADKVPQSTLKSSERRRNVKNIFKVRQPVFKNCNVLLIDDVVTTGATLDELAKTLKKSGANRVCCWVLARPQLKR